MKAIVCPKSGHIYSAPPEVHQIQPGETLGDVAAGADLTVEMLLAFNCASVAPPVVNHYLRTVLGCSEPGPDGYLQLAGSGALALPGPLEWQAGEEKNLELELWRCAFCLRLRHPTPDAGKPVGTSYVLQSDDGAYRSVQTAGDDVDHSNHYLDLTFFGLLPGVSYTLEMKTGEGEPRPLFEGVPYEELAGAPGQSAQDGSSQ